MKEIVLFLLLIPAVLFAGPPYDTDDPEPVMFQHWEVYFSSHIGYAASQWAGTGPHLEVNYGVLPNTQLHLITPLAFAASGSGKLNYGYGDTELGIKFRFVDETSSLPQVGIFPLVELPSGNAQKELGSGRTQVFLPVWLQKTFGKWTTYGGAGYWINQGNGNRDWQFYGLQVQYQLTEKMSLGTELYHVTPNVRGGRGETRFNVGSVIDLSKFSHLLFSAGSSINGTTQLQCYFGYQMTFGKSRKKA